MRTLLRSKVLKEIILNNFKDIIDDRDFNITLPMLLIFNREED